MRADRPTTDELLEAVEEYLRNEALPALEGRTAFNARVAANVLGIVRREVARGELVDEAQRNRLAALLGKEGDATALNRELCRQIKAGEADMDDPALIEHLRLYALEYLGIDNPRYSAYKQAMEDS